MQILNRYKNYFFSIFSSAVLLMMASCVDEDFNNTSSSGYDPANDPDMVMLPLNLNMGITVSTREGEEDSPINEDHRWGQGTTSGTKEEHKVDFDTENECFAIFFDGYNRVKYMKPLTTTEQIGDGTPSNTSGSEFSITAITYVKKKDIDSNLLNGRSEKTLISSVLVVLNGGKIYNNIKNQLEELVPGSTNLEEKEGEEDIDSPDAPLENGKNHITDIRKMVWELGSHYFMDPVTSEVKFIDNPDMSLGFNGKGYFTMTNSSYIDKDENDGNKLKEIIAAKVVKDRYYTSISHYIKTPQDQRDPSAVVYLERMVAKFSAPTFQTQVIGPDLVFRPDLNALPLVVYNWDEENNLLSSQKNWRIHLTGWAINGEETLTYVFKKIPDLQWHHEVGSTDFWNWYDMDAKRSFWSIDPHYDDKDRVFYPWQYRKVADLKETVSVQAGMSANQSPSLRYYTFDEVHNTWADVLYSPENTFDAEKYIPYSESILDGRSSYVAGPHLLITGELYLQDENGTAYESNGQKFGKVQHIYSDRIRRYFLTEADWFKMFLRDFNRTLTAQENMSFTKYDWSENSQDKTPYSCSAVVPGDCRLYMRSPENSDKYSGLDENAPVIIKNGEKFTQLTYNLIDKLYKGSGSFSHIANVRNGDGRLIPWIDDICILSQETQNELVCTTTDPEYNRNGNKWTDNMYKSMFYDWFGPIDHYVNGYMYYAGDIKHAKAGNTQYYGTVRNHWYKFHVESINSLGVPVDNTTQLIIPGNYNYRDQIIVYLDIIDWHPKSTEVGL